MAKALVIVESPAKSKTLEKFLGKDYEVEASMGHVIDLPRTGMGVDIENNFTPKYSVLPDKKKTLAKLKKDSKDKKDIYLATDPDREGEAISWHLAGELGKGKNVYRVEFHEITKDAVQEAFKHPREIQINLVNAQQARRILDRVVGYSVSPLLWKKVGRGLSAGRVQSVALRLIVEREREIRAFKPEEYWSVEADLIAPRDKKKFRANLEKIDNAKAEIKNKDQADSAIKEIEKEKFIVSQVKDTKKKKYPYAPFTTSKLQQAAFNKLHFSAYKTMMVAQALYEGLEVGEEGRVGLITYMRTDSVKVSKESQEQAKKYITKKFGKDYVPSQFNVYKSKKRAQEAHEAIRPTSVLKEPQAIKEYLDENQFKLYDLIWKEFVASQMSPAELKTTSADINSGKYLFRASGTTVLFDGFMKVYFEEKEEETLLPDLQVNDELKLIELIPGQHFTKPPARYTEASLVKVLEEKGIGRPSTYAPIIYTITVRNYVKREGSSLAPTELGEAVTDLIVASFPKIFDVEFTAAMEDELDLIEEGKIEWVTVLKDFYKPFSEALENAKVEMKSLKKEVETLEEKCPECGKNLVIKWGRSGKFISCSDFPKCRYARSITSGVKCPQEGCGGELVSRRSKRGFFYGCTNYPKCRYITKRLPNPEGEKDSKEAA